MFTEKKKIRRRAACLLAALICLFSMAGASAEGLGLEKYSWEDQYGNIHTPEEFRGKVVVLNFWATWCQWCVREMPDFQRIYEELGSNEGDVLIFGVASRETEYTRDESGVKEFLKKQGFTYPTLMDSEGILVNMFGIEAFPTSFFMCADGTVAGYTYTLLGDELKEVIAQVQGMGAEKKTAE